MNEHNLDASAILKAIYEPVLKSMLEKDSALMNMFDKRTPGQKEAARKRWEAKQAARRATHDRNIGNASSLGRMVLELHSPSKYMDECDGCDGGPDYSGDWPCRTYRLIVEHDGLETP